MTLSITMPPEAKCLTDVWQIDLGTDDELIDAAFLKTFRANIILMY
eukprot:CAMPEP_0119042522 /NCGR_PEP_ID=MMETSP1177-20130426/15721_1 /TAXON_ID=2985 /ORGANISM="Ochromonas sp, Strain CCMP1899" /LENGTH=45 /DNA_ID= /DNA_START= /DNA_END= /DNA_ORIENTATION=